MLRVLSERGVAVDQLTLLASPRSSGRRVSWEGRDWTINAPAPGCFQGVDCALFSAGADRSREWAPRAVAEGAVVVDNSSAWRMDPEVPLVVPEVNAAAASSRPKGIVANPNCSTIQMVLPLQALHAAAGLRRVVVTTFQSVSGAGETGLAALRSERTGGAANEGTPFSRMIDGNVVPQIGDFDADGWTGEERKMRGEARKILDLPRLALTATCVRVPVEVGHSLQLTVETERELPREAAASALEGFPGIVLSRGADDYPTPREFAGRDEVHVGRLRSDPDCPRTLHLWVVADNLRKGAATNAVQILEGLSGA